MHRIDPPPAPRTVDDTGIEPKVLLNLLLKIMYVQGLATASRLSEVVKLPRVIVATLLDEARDLALLEALGTVDRDTVSEMRYGLTSKGRDWATDALALSQYVGPAPVPLDDFHAQVEKQRIRQEQVPRERLVAALADLVLPDELVHRLGPAVNSGKSVLLYGASGNGKTCIAEAMGRSFRDSIFLPYCIEVDGQIINFLDATVHRPVAVADGLDGFAGGAGSGPSAGADPRWVRCHRPVVITGGELALPMLDMIFNPHEKFYEAPLQLKATGGVFIIDDFGRQRTDPHAILNRWIIPLERGIDYLTLHTGKKFPVPFDALVVFATNMPPRDISDEAMLRRLYYKIEVPPPTREDYRRIFAAQCERHALELPDDLVPFLFEEFYGKKQLGLAGYHPKYLIDQVIALCRYDGRPPRLDRESLRLAWQNLYAT